MKNQSKIDLIIDTDSAFDDWWAILFLLHHPQVNVIAFTVVGTGEAHPKQGAINIAKLCKLANRSNIPIFYGDAKPLSGNNAFPDYVRDSVDQLLGITLFKGETFTHVKPDAVDALYHLLRCKAASILAIGPLTNIASLIQKYPDVKTNIDRLVVMGGAVNVEGNIQDLIPEVEDNSAEWNFYCDPIAASIVLSSGLAIELVPLDITNQFPMTKEFIDKCRLFSYVRRSTLSVKHFLNY